MIHKPSIYNDPIPEDDLQETKAYTCNCVCTSADGEYWQSTLLEDIPSHQISICINTKAIDQKIEGFGGSFTKSSAVLFHKMNAENKKRFLDAYFGPEGAQYTLMRTHINSCDFSPYSYCYAPEEDITLSNFNMSEDKNDIFLLIKKAQQISDQPLKIVASPWTAPPWMKDNNAYCGGKLLKKYYSLWAEYIALYLQQCLKNEIPIWAITIQNEPLGNDCNWESMHLKDWANKMYNTKNISDCYDGIAVHWYGSTTDAFTDNLNFVHQVEPNKMIIQTEACIDAQIPQWKNDDWYWHKNATDWGYTWAPENKKHLHTPYVPIHRYIIDIISCLNHHVHGWIDWNLVLDRQGGPNWAKNWCIAPVIFDTLSQELYFTPLYYAMKHFSKHIQPGAYRLLHTISQSHIYTTVFQNFDNNIVVILFNPTNLKESIDIEIDGCYICTCPIKANALYTLTISSHTSNH